MYPFVTFTVMSLNADLILSAVCHMLRSYASKSIEIHLTLEEAAARWCLRFVAAAFISWRHSGLLLCCLIGF